MATASDGMNYAPKGKPAPVVRDGESFNIAVAAMDHGHIYGQVNGLTEAGATLKYVYDANDPAKARALADKTGAQHVTDLSVILDDPDVQLVAAAAIANVRAELGVRCMDAGKHYFTDKTPLTSLEQLRDVWSAVERTGRKYMVYYSERLHVESAMHAGTLIQQGAIGRVIHVEGFGPHRMGDPEARPAWFFRRREYGGILNDIGSHQIEQFLHYAGCKDATITAARVGNYGNPNFPELEDFGDCTLTGDNGATMYFRVDWFTPKNAKVWGDGRTFILGTDGYIELRKYRDIATQKGPGDVLIMVNADGETRMELAGKVGFKFFGQLIRDCLDHTEHAMSQAHALKAAELCVKAQLYADSQRRLG